MVNFMYEEEDMTDDAKRQDFYQNIMDNEGLTEPVNTVPQIFFDNKRIGGYTELMKTIQYVLIMTNYMMLQKS